MSHTPGPWRIEMGEGDEADRVYGIYGLNDEKIVETDGGVYPPELPDARLIVKSPELLAMLHRAMEAEDPDAWLSDAIALLKEIEP